MPQLTCNGSCPLWPQWVVPQLQHGEGGVQGKGLSQAQCTIWTSIIATQVQVLQGPGCVQ